MTEIREMNYRCQTVVCTGVKEVVELDNLEDFPWHGGKSKRKRFSITILLTAATAQTRPSKVCLWQVWEVPSGGD